MTDPAIIPILGFILFVLSVLLIVFMLLWYGKYKEASELRHESEKLWSQYREMKEHTDEVERELEKTLAQVKILISKML